MIPCMIGVRHIIKSKPMGMFDRHLHRRNCILTLRHYQDVSPIDIPQTCSIPASRSIALPERGGGRGSSTFDRRHSAKRCVRAALVIVPSAGLDLGSGVGDPAREDRARLA